MTKSTFHAHTIAPRHSPPVSHLDTALTPLKRKPPHANKIAAHIFSDKSKNSCLS